MTEKQYNFVEVLQSALTIVDRLGIKASLGTNLPLQIVNELDIKEEDKQPLMDSIRTILHIINNNE